MHFLYIYICIYAYYMGISLINDGWMVLDLLSMVCLMFPLEHPQNDWGIPLGRCFMLLPSKSMWWFFFFWGDFTQDKGVESMLGLYICIWTKHGRHRAHQWIPMMDFNTKGLMPGLSRAWGWGQNVFFVQKRRIYPKYPKLSKVRWLIGKS